MMRNDTCSVHTLEAVGYTALFLLGLALNAAALYVFVTKRAHWTETHVYMVNLVAADLALILFLPFRIYDAVFCLEKSRLCTFLISTHYINMYASILTIVAISVHRYVAVRFPLQARAWRRKKQVALGVCLAIWVVVVALSSGARQGNHPKNLWTCYERCKNIPLPLSMILLLVILGYLAPLLIMVFCSGRTLCVLFKAKEEGLSAGKRNIASVVIANMVVFTVCFTPIHVSFLLNYYMANEEWHFEHTASHRFLLAAEWISTSNCCLDAISYYFLLKRFYRNRFTETVRYTQR